MEPWAIWLVIGFVLLIAEMLTLSFFLLWLGLGAVAGALAAWVAPDSFFVQALAFIVVAGVLTAFTKPLSRRLRSSKAKDFKDAIEDLVGKQGVVTVAIEPGKPGIVKVGSETWTAYAEEELAEGKTVTIVSRGTTQVEVRPSGGDR
ncbi:NfeD family protein [Cohnella lubricantis]|uniref:NfeD family protein n=1 Tax=Cohnella lubricantis TaxID=2163172 RepID=A0A841TCY6_9BACL|nr:NfeD family protein [Cohnella lubricantis]MBB6677100.1 NfeD family protein [Cohnella lubricantis]MBP2118947.1 membrane protein implicated in regulation of membrane protease activity [Cohnella lubricantis]